MTAGAFQGKRQQRKSYSIIPRRRKEGDAATSSMTSSETSFAQGGEDQTCCCCSSKKGRNTLATNAGVKHSNQEAVVPGFGKVYFDKDAIANIFRYPDLKKRDRITYDSDREARCFIAFIRRTRSSSLNVAL